eukprot:NODE_5774_length_639_cov_4.022034_g5383_i0.p1 GENE.NODE_5774_length_639_cov_4.022034_g5383_i0~~NODE_5774_length_639_cov_4.022034_g5383_i0.p1  ORF type:complete len:177 (-),score=26.44 NODE_5774_length_639_cov_4.022034_g5383_i0:109-639(-)
MFLRRSFGAVARFSRSVLTEAERGPRPLPFPDYWIQDIGLGSSLWLRPIPPKFAPSNKDPSTLFIKVEGKILLRFGKGFDPVDADATVSLGIADISHFLAGSEFSITKQDGELRVSAVDGDRVQWSFHPNEGPPPAAVGMTSGEMLIIRELLRNSLPVLSGFEAVFGPTSEQNCAQ